jgi:hypothetical protein
MAPAAEKPGEARKSARKKSHSHLFDAPAKRHSYLLMRREKSGGFC